MEFPDSENLSCKKGFIAVQCLPDECSSVTYLWSYLLEGSISTSSGFAQEMVEILLTSSKHMLKSQAILPSHGFALVR